MSGGAENIVNNITDKKDRLLSYEELDIVMDRIISLNQFLLKERADYKEGRIF